VAVTPSARNAPDWICGNAGDRDDVPRDIDGVLLIERDVDCVRTGDLEKRVAVSGRTRDACRASNSFARDTMESIQFQHDPQKFFHSLRGCNSRAVL
jgi:hypothetical protein